MSIQKINRKSRPFLVRCRDFDGRIVSATFATKSEAEEFEASHKGERKMPAVLQIDAIERADIARLKKLCEKHGTTIAMALPLFEQFLKNSQMPQIDFATAVSLFMDFLDAKKVRPRTRGFYQTHVRRLQRWAGDRNIAFVANLSHDNAQQYINGVLCKPQAKRALRAFFNFLRDSGYVAQNAFTTAKIPKILRDKPKIEIMTVDATRDNLAAIRPEFKPLYALMTFAGIRPEELIFDKSGANAKRDSLGFADIDFTQKRIIVRASVAKTREERIITGLTNIWGWLEPIKKWKAIYPLEMTMQRACGNRKTTRNIYQQWLKAKRDLPHKIPQDALRHSFASYAYHVFGVEKAVEILGHDYNVYRKFYKSIATEEESIAYFEIRPTA